MPRSSPASGSGLGAQTAAALARAGAKIAVLDSWASLGSTLLASSTSSKIGILMAQ
jgi:NAD(P)-dependent dehydrogenase (short-subunit alcohol dehydrogenase family)